MGGASWRKGARISAAKTAGRRLHRVFLGNGRAAKRLRSDARKLSRAMHRGLATRTVLAGRTLPEHYSNEPCHRLHGWLCHALYGWWNGRASAHLAAGVYTCGVYPIQDHLHGGCTADPEKPRARLARAICGSSVNETAHIERTGSGESHGDSPASEAVVEPSAAEECSPGLWRRIASASRWRRFHRAEDSRIFSRYRHPNPQRVWMHGGLYGYHRERYETVSARYLG